MSYSRPRTRLLHSPPPSCELYTFHSIISSRHRDDGPLLGCTAFPQNVPGRELYTPCSPVDPAGIVMSVFEVPANSLQEPPVNIEDFMTALDRCKPSVGQAEIDKNDDWTRQFGQEGA